MYNVSFQAKYISTSVVKKKLPSSGYENCRVNFVQFEASDLPVIKKLPRRWNEGIVHGFVRDAELELKNTNDPSKSSKFYAMTKNACDLNKLKLDDILSIAEVSYSCLYDMHQIDYLCVEPLSRVNAKPSKGRNYLSLGTQMLNKIKKLYEGKDFFLFSMYSAIPFYKSNGFKLVDDELGLMSFEA